MLDQVEQRRTELGLSLRQLAKSLEVSPTLLSLTLTGKREASKGLSKRLKAWLDAPTPIDRPNSPATVLRQFLAERSAHLSERTMVFYQQKLTPFVRWCEERRFVDLRRVSRAEAGEFLAQMRKGRAGQFRKSVKPLNNGALKLHHQTLKTLFNYVSETCEVPAGWQNPAVAIKVKPSQAQTMEFSEAEIDCMLRIAASVTDPVIALRDTAIIRVLLNSAMRQSELLAMNVQDVSDDGRARVSGKGSKDRIVSIGKTGIEAVRAYLGARQDATGPLWTTNTGARLTASGLAGVFRRMEAQSPASFTESVHPHRFRHTAITRMLRARVPLRSVQRYAGHTSPQTTLRYAQAIDAEDAMQFVHSM